MPYKSEEFIKFSSETNHCCQNDNLR